MVTTWTGAAKRDLQQIHQRLAAADPVAAKSTIEAIVAGADDLHETFQAGRPEALLNGEKVPYKFITVGYYKILYTFNTEKVSIRSVFHVRQMAEQNQAVIDQLNVKAEQVAADAAAAALAAQAAQAAAAAATPPPPPPVAETPPVVETPIAETPPVVETPITEPVIDATVNSQITDAITNENVEVTGETPAEGMTSTAATEPPPMASAADLEALKAKMGNSEVTPDAGDGGFDAAALEAELMADDAKEEEEKPEIQDFSIDNLDDTTKPDGGQS